MTKTAEFVFKVLGGLIAAALIVCAVGIYQQLGPCEKVCAGRGQDCVGTTVPPWGDDMECLCTHGPDRVRRSAE